MQNPEILGTGNLPAPSELAVQYLPLDKYIYLSKTNPKTPEEAVGNNLGFTQVAVPQDATCESICVSEINLLDETFSVFSTKPFERNKTNSTTYP